MIEDIEPRLFEAVEDASAAEPRRAQLVAQPAADAVADRAALLELRARARRTVAERRRPRRVDGAGVQRIRIGAM